jgi:hypothetical protein
MHPQTGKGLQISLDARLSAAVGAGDGQGDGCVGLMHFLAPILNLNLNLNLVPFVPAAKKD